MKKDGTLHSLRVDTMAWASGYLSRAMLAGSITLVWGMGHYRCNNIDGSFQVVYTNTRSPALCAASATRGHVGCRSAHA